MIKDAAIWTMIRNEDFFLRTWVDYYSRFVPRENLFILVDGHDSFLPDSVQGCQIITFPRSDPKPGWDNQRWTFLSHFASSLTTRFELVIGGDVDELIVLDPTYGNDPLQYLLNETDAPVISPFAIEIVHRVDLEKKLDTSKKILSQRSFGRINTWYCKPSIIRIPIRWGLGQHFSDHPVLHLSDALYNFHLRYVDHDMLVERQEKRFQHVTDSENSLLRGVAGVGWHSDGNDISSYLKSFVEHGPPKQGNFAFRPLRRKMKKDWHLAKSGLWRHARVHRMTTHVIPERFNGTF